MKGAFTKKASAGAPRPRPSAAGKVAERQQRHRRYRIDGRADKKGRPAGGAGERQQQRPRGKAGGKRGSIEADDASATCVARQHVDPRLGGGEEAGADEAQADPEQEPSADAGEELHRQEKHDVEGEAGKQEGADAEPAYQRRRRERPDDDAKIGAGGVEAGETGLGATRLE